jgi:nitric oxide reductase NorQ protein
MTQLERLAASDYVARKDLVYVDVAGLHDLYGKVAFKGNHILVGPKGIGKSLSVQAYAGKLNVPVVTFDCSEDVRRSNLLGTFILRGEETPYVLGPVTTAFEIANEKGSCVLVLEEINALTPQMQKILNAATDFRRRVEVPEAKKVFQLKKNKKLWIVCTMNFSVYGGVYALNEDLKSRFRMVPLTYPKRKEEAKILTTVMGDAGSELPAGVIEKLVLLAHETRQGAIEYALSTRDLQQIAEDTLLVGLQKALWISCGKFEGDDVDAYKRRIESIFDEVTLIRGDHDDTDF